MDKRLEKIEEIEKQRDALAKERDAIRKEIDEEKRKQELDERITYIGKCYKLKRLCKSESYPNVIAFKILSIDSEDRSYYARCVTITKGHRYTCWTEYGILNQVLSLWYYDTKRMMHNSSDKRTIELFEEISEEEFNIMKEEAYKNIEKDCDNRKVSSNPLLSKR